MAKIALFLITDVVRFVVFIVVLLVVGASVAFFDECAKLCYGTGSYPCPPHG